ncbi:MAG: FAD-dependent oxidoreductase [Ilumatobacteraceae bacterium]
MRARPFERSEMLDELRTAAAGDPFDVVVIGGGITGAGVALDAATRGLRVALVERDDLASGTSSKSSKLVHGGLRYLQNGDVKLVYQALRERKRLMRNAPHLVRVLPFLIPILTKDSAVSRKIARGLGSAMWMYDLTGGWRIGRLHKRVSAEQAAAHFPTAPADRLSAGYLYYDATADDARLTLTIARTAAEHGAVVINRCGVVDVTVGVDGRASGVVVEADGERIEVPARGVVNAAGVWSDEVRALDEGTDPDSIRPAKGVHIAVPWEKTRNDIAVIIPVRRDKRSLFLAPHGELPDGTFRHTYIGTTDTDYDGRLDAPQCDGDDLDYVLEAVNQALTTEVTRDDVVGVWAGLRPLVKSDDPEETSEKTADLSRQHVVEVGPSGVVRVGGGKLTTYREMAEDTVDRLSEEIDAPRRARRSHPTRRLPLFGAEPPGSYPRGSVDAHLAERYGAAAPEIKALVALDPDLGEPLVEGQPYLRAEAVYAARREMATTLDDVLLRRTRAHLFDRPATERAAPAVAALLGRELGWDAAETERQVDRYLQICAAEKEAGDHLTHAAD